MKLHVILPRWYYPVSICYCKIIGIVEIKGNNKNIEKITRQIRTTIRSQYIWSLWQRACFQQLLIWLSWVSISQQSWWRHLRDPAYPHKRRDWIVCALRTCKLVLQNTVGGIRMLERRVYWACMWSFRSFAWNCMTLIAGKNATTTGQVLVAHNEDDNVYCKVYRGDVPQMIGRQALWSLLKMGGQLNPSIEHTHGYLWVEVKAGMYGLSNADTYFNDAGILIDK